MVERLEIFLYNPTKNHDVIMRLKEKVKPSVEINAHQKCNPTFIQCYEMLSIAYNEIFTSPTDVWV